MPAGWIEQPTSPLRVARSTTELSGHCRVLGMHVIKYQCTIKSGWQGGAHEKKLGLKDLFIS